MTDELLIQSLLEHILESHCTPEEACIEYPELLSRVRKRLMQVRRVENQLEVFFPTLHSEKGSKADFSALKQLPTIDGYDIQSILGYGGMGVVYTARHLKLNRIVALKMLLAGPHATSQEVARFVRESQAVAGLQHPNIVQVYDVADLGGHPYFTMEFVEGGSLAEELSGDPLDPRRAVEVTATLARAVQAAHVKGIIHRDLKPANILLTADGIPKIADFGLARHVEGDPTLTMTGARLGTPSYMAPEQAVGASNAIGPSVDVYALGAILYEMLTGRPPFRAATAIETQRQIVMVDVVRPSKLNASVPHDLDTICMKCLQKEPHRRYASAAALADDLKRFQCEEPILARPVGRVEKITKWTNRNRLLAVSMLSGILACGVCAAIGWKFILDRMVVAQSTENDLQEVKAALHQQDWNAAQSALHRAAGRVGSAGHNSLATRIERYRREIQLVDQLDLIRLKRADPHPGVDRFKTAAASYEQLFRETGLLTLEEAPQSAAERILSTDVAPAILVAIDDWSLFAQPKRSEWLREVARLTDVDTSNTALRDALNQTDPTVLVNLAADITIEGQSVALMVLIGQVILQKDGDAVPFLKRVQQVHPDDFWVNVTLALSTYRVNPAESVRYFQAAIAIRPNSADVHDCLGTALARSGRLDEALSEFVIATRLDPSSANFHFNHGLALSHLGHHEISIEVLRRAVEIRPDFADAHGAIGLNLLNLNRPAEAIIESRLAVAQNPTLWLSYTTIRNSQLKLGQNADALTTWKEVLARNPASHDEWDGFAELCLFLNRDDEYRVARQNLLKRFGNTTDPFIAERTGRSCLFLEASAEELRQATALIDLALSNESPQTRNYWRYFRFAKGLAEYRAGRYESASEYIDSETLQVLGPAPRLLLAMIQHRLNLTEEARQNYDTAIAAFEWNLDNVMNADKWRYHLLRREAEAVLKTSS